MGIKSVMISLVTLEYFDVVNRSWKCSRLQHCRVNLGVARGSYIFALNTGSKNSFSVSGVKFEAVCLWLSFSTLVLRPFSRQLRTSLGRNIHRSSPGLNFCSIFVIKQHFFSAGRMTLMVCWRNKFASTISQNCYENE